MALLTAFLVLGLLVSTAWASEGFVDTERQGCRVARIAGVEAAAAARWSGRCVKGFGDGPGVLSWWANGRIDRSYTGVLHNGAFERYAKLERPNGETQFVTFQAAKAGGAAVAPSTQEGQTLEGNVRAAIKQHVMCVDVELGLKLSEGIQRIAEGASADRFAMQEITKACAPTYKKLELAARALAKDAGADEKAMAAFAKEIHLEAQRAAISATWLAKAAHRKPE